MLCSTAIAAVLALMPQAGNAGDAPKPTATQTKTRPAKADTRWTLPDPISPDVVRNLTDAQWRGPNGLVAGVFDQVRARPAMRDAVVNYAQGLAPALKRDLATAGDLAVLTANEKLMLAPNSGAVLNSMRASNAGSTVNMASAFANSPASIGPQAAPVPAPTVYTQSWNRDMIGAQIANARGANYTGSGVTVAVGDTGFDVNNDALKNRLNTTLAKNYVINNSTTAYDPSYVGLQASTDNHGSHVAGTIAAEPVAGVDMRGVAYNARIIPIRVVLGGDEAPDATYPASVPDPLKAALDYFKTLNNVMVYNASYGPKAEGTGLSAWSVSPTSDMVSVGEVLEKGKIIVAATGNDRLSNPTAGKNPSGMGLYPYIRSAHANTGVYIDSGGDTDLKELSTQTGLIIAVMAVGAEKQAAGYSNLCGVAASWCVAAPGGDFSTGSKLAVYSTIPDNTYGGSYGTSMAAPTVSGALAVLIGAFPSYNARDIARLLFSTTEDLGAPGVDAVFGYGLIRLDRATEPVNAPAPGGSVTVAENQTVYWAPPVLTAGGFTKDGKGLLTISGRTTTAGTVTVADGIFAVTARSA